MIIYSNKGFETRSDKPDSDWTTDKSALYVVPDGSALARKIQESYPYYDFVTDGDGALIDITPTERPPEPEPEPTADELISAFMEGYNGQS